MGPEFPARFRKHCNEVFYLLDSLEEIYRKYFFALSDFQLLKILTYTG
jgi:hypothetical protein